MQTPSLEPLLNEEDFLAELVNLDRGLSATQRTPLPPVQQKVLDPFPGLPSAVLTPEPEQGVATEELDAAPSIVWRVVAAAMFVLMVGVGAASAAVVFHDRVARILAAW